MRTIEAVVYGFAELDDDAKEIAREWYRSGAPHGDMDVECTLDYADECARIIGIDMTRGGGGPKISFSVGGGGGDYAVFEGNYAYAKGASKAIRAHAPKDTELHRIADILQAVQARHFYQLVARMKCSTRRLSEHVLAEVFTRDGYDASDSASSTVREAMQDFASWIQHVLADEYYYQLSDEVTDETIIANEYEFTADGRHV